jgi:hypothetical protein
VSTEFDEGDCVSLLSFIKSTPVSSDIDTTKGNGFAGSSMTNWMVSKNADRISLGAALRRMLKISANLMCGGGVLFVIIYEGGDVRKGIVRRFERDHPSRLNILL